MRYRVPGRFCSPFISTQHTMVISCKGLIHLTSGPNVLITGASRGLGEAIAREFCKTGANLILVARSGERLAALAEEFGAFAVAADLSDPEAGAAVLRAARERVERLAWGWWGVGGRWCWRGGDDRADIGDDCGW